MWFTLCALGFISGVVWLGWWYRNRYQSLRYNPHAPVKEQIVQLPLRGLTHQRLRHEVKIFNKMCLVLPTRQGVAVAYQEQLTALLREPTHQPGTDPYEKLFYGYACAVLLQKKPPVVVTRQLQKNLLFVFAPKRKIVQRRRVTLATTFDPWCLVPTYKIFDHEYLDPRQPDFRTEVPLSLSVNDSYLKYYHHDLVIRRYENFYELTAVGTQKITLVVAADKSDYTCQINRGTITCKNLTTGAVKTYTVRGEQVRLGTSLCAATDALEIYLTWQGQATVSVNHGTKQLLSPETVAWHRQAERIVTAAYHAKYIHGQKLRLRYQAAEKYVPSLRLLTRVVLVNEPDDFLHVWQDLTIYQRVATLFGGFNLVFVYPGVAPLVADLVAEMVTPEQRQACQQAQLLLYFVDRTVTDPDALYFLTRMAGDNFYAPPAMTTTTATLPKTFPYVKSLTVANPAPHPVTKQLIYPLVFTTPMIVTVDGSVLQAVGLYTGRISTYHLPTVYHQRDEFLTTHLNLPIKIKLQGFEQKQLTVTRMETTTRRRLRAKDLVAALSEIVVTTMDKNLNTIFVKPVNDGEDAATLHLVKLADKNVDRKILVAALGDKHALTADVWQYLLTKIIGVRLAGGKIYLAPNVNLLGEFTLSGVCHGEKFIFNTRKYLPNNQSHATIPYGQKIERN